MGKPLQNIRKIGAFLSAFLCWSNKALLMLLMTVKSLILKFSKHLLLITLHNSVELNTQMMLK